MRRPWTSLTRGFALAIVALTLPVAPASAGPGGLKYVAEGKTAAAGGPGWAFAWCPASRHVLGGGVQSGGDFGQQHVVGTWPLEGDDPDTWPDDGWGVWVDNLTGIGGTALHVRAHAICAKGQVDYKSAGGFAIDPGDTRTVSLGGCGGPQGTQVTGGGVKAALGFSENYIARTYPVPGGMWGSTVHNVSSSVQYMHAYAICAPGNYAYVSKAKGIGPLEQARIQSRCPGGTHVVGGGAYATGDFRQLHLNASYPRDLGDPDQAPDDAWRVKTDDLDPGTRTMIVYAICKG